MKKLIVSILILNIITIGCKNPNRNNYKFKKTNFDLLNDYSNFQKQMSESDTILVWMNMSVCLRQGMEKFIITKEKDSLNILLYYKESAFSDKEYVEQKTIKISENDTTWNFGKFLTENRYRIKPNERSLPNFSISLGSAKFYFYTDGLADFNRFIIDYSVAMRRLDPKNPIYKMADYADKIENQ